MTLCRRVGYYYPHYICTYYCMTCRARTANPEPPLPLQSVVHLSYAMLLLLELFTIHIK